MTGTSTTTRCGRNSQYLQAVVVSQFGTEFALMLPEPKMEPTQTKPNTLRLHSLTGQGITLAQTVKPSGSMERHRGASLHGNRREHGSKGGTHSLASPAQGSPSVPVRKSVDYVFYRDTLGTIDMATPGDPYPVDSLLLALGTPDGLMLLFNGPINPLFTTHGERVEIESVYSKLTGDPK